MVHLDKRLNTERSVILKSALEAVVECVVYIKKILTKSKKSPPNTLKLPYTRTKLLLKVMKIWSRIITYYFSIRSVRIKTSLNQCKIMHSLLRISGILNESRV
jgi:hypothetical protein